MAKGENIFKRKDGRWEARYIKGYELSGKIKYGFCYGKTYREAKEKVTKCKAALVNGKPIPSTNSRHRFSFYCDEWLRMRKPKVKESTYIKYDTALRKHIKPRLGGCFPLAFNDGLIEQFANELLFEEELAPKTVKDILVVLHSIEIPFSDFVLYQKNDRISALIPGFRSGAQGTSLHPIDDLEKVLFSARIYSICPALLGCCVSQRFTGLRCLRKSIGNTNVGDGHGGHSSFYGRFYNFCRTVDGSDTAKLRMAVQFYPCPGIRIAVIHPVCTPLLLISYRYYLMTCPFFVPCHGYSFCRRE